LTTATHDFEGMRPFIGADWLAFVPVDGIGQAIGCQARDPAPATFIRLFHAY